MTAPYLRIGRPPTRPSSFVNYLLINPPLTSPVNPYHSIPYLIGPARSAGFTGYCCIDANIESLNYLSSPNRVAALLQEASMVRARIDVASQCTRADELRYRAALSGEGLREDFVENAIRIFRDPELFYHYPTYRQATMAIRRWFELLSLRGTPAVFDGLGLRMTGAVNFTSLVDLTDAVVDEVTAPFLPYIQGPFRALLGARDWEVVGLSVNYHTQLPFALRLAREVRDACPNAVILFGGTEVGDNVKYARDPMNVWKLFAHADLVVPGEGESPLIDALRAVRDREPLADIRGALARDDELGSGSINYENVASLPGPAYDVWDWPAYWAPEPILLYSPTRGCYWNRCTFCDYGLNTDRPTSPSRERPVDAVIDDLENAAQHGRTVYLAVDAMSPKYLRTLASAMAESPHRFRWSAELRLERTFPKRQVAELLARSGCVSISFGYESGSQRILDLIDKGVRISEVPAILDELATHGIAAQMMGFTGFPSETSAEAEETYDFLARHGAQWSLAGIDTFLLTPGAIVARQPERFGVEVLPAPQTDDIERFFPWRDRSTGTIHWPGDSHPIPPRLRGAIIRCVDGQPFVGGIDSGHTLLYFARFGKRLLPESISDEPRIRIVEGTVCTVGFAELTELTSPPELDEAHSALRRGGKGASYEAIGRWLAQPGRGRRGSSRVTVLPSGLTLSLPETEHGQDSAKLRTLVDLLARSRGDA